MNKYKGFTIAEIAIAMIIIMIISAFAVQYFKPDAKKLRLFTYAAIQNLQKGNSAVTGKYQIMNQPSVNSVACAPSQFSLGCTDCSDGINCNACAKGFELTVDSRGGTPKQVCQDKITDLITYFGVSSEFDSYCVRLTDNYSLKDVECKVKTAGDATVNIRFPNGSTIQGLSTPWVTPYTDSEYQFKNIVFDIDGEKGANKVWVDRVPLRIYAGGTLNGTVMPVNCIAGQDYVYNKDTQVVLTGNDANPYCKQKWNATGSSANKNFLLDDVVLSYDIFRLASVEEQADAKMVVGSLSLMHANCKAYGADGVFHKNECSLYDDNVEKMNNKKGIRIDQKCVTDRHCNSCWKDAANNICPRKDDGSDVVNYEECKAIQQKYNPDNINCFMLPHKPSAGASFIFNGVLDSIDL